ncbi:Outer membrane protein TolC [Neorhodopirellula lusitana]|uniref:Outer membrane protein TolC n=1 Tax=Neorhodopirellula lusitana TaxID=445327 RepID=A0ABY1QBV8_9BACT|nr:TolC family protein [Neorhodopirellula lusitana]SMP66578.1 Outer membrane protein TolC [Neorhodopirellula lusitana]
MMKPMVETCVTRLALPSVCTLAVPFACMSDMPRACTIEISSAPTIGGKRGRLSAWSARWGVLFSIAAFPLLALLIGVSWNGSALADEPSLAGELNSDSLSFSQFLMISQDEIEAIEPGSATDGFSEANSAPRASSSDSQAAQSSAELPDPQAGSSASLANEAASDDAFSEDALMLADVIASVYRSYPEILQARQQTGLTSGEALSASGAYDTKFQAYSLSEPTGFYENYRNGLKLARQTWWGGYVEAGYRIGRGYYQPWYKERQTDDAGEFKTSIIQPLLNGRAIDPQRVAVFQARLAQQAVGPSVQLALLNVSLDATTNYWQWVAAGAALRAQRELLELAEKRGEQYEAGVKAGKFAEIDLILNQQLIAERATKVLETERKYRETTFKLGLFLRDESGQPIVASDDWGPQRFPVIQPPPPGNFEADLAAALTRRPEPQILQYQIRGIQLDRQLACNDMLPRFDFVAEASQDMGEPATKSDDKGEFELVIGFTSEVPIQRRKARGKVQSTTAKIAQTNEKLRLVRDKIGVELRTAYNGLALAGQIVEQSEVSLRAVIDTLDRYRFAFERGKIDLIYLNLLETKANETEIKLIEAQQNWFAALAQMQIALGLDPLEQAMVVSSLPPSKLPTSLDLQEFEDKQAEALLQDWQLHNGQPKEDAE